MVEHFGDRLFKKIRSRYKPTSYTTTSIRDYFFLSFKDKNLISSAKFSELIMQFSEDKLRAVNVEVALEFIKDLQANEYISNESYLKINDLICSNYYKKQLSNK